ncbi:MAG TPA: SIMPL domain-containing protein [Candidatus Methylomirabilis sp.]|nr:SIMPL domain-containing protein [Candidatus Methylomirabilis sp.]
MISSAGVARRVTVGMAVLMLCGACTAMGQEQAVPPRPMTGRPEPPSITVVGSGTAAVRPDTAEVTAGVVTQAPAAAQALTQNNVVMDKVLKAVAALGISDKDVQTTNLNVLPQRRSGRPESASPEIVGYEVSNQARIKMRDLAILGRLLDTLVGQGANALGAISFSVAEPAPVLDQARTKAMADARRKAELYAQAAGVKLGPVLSIRETTAAIPRLGGEMPRAVMMSAVPVAPGEQEFQASITVTYELR